MRNFIFLLLLVIPAFEARCQTGVTTDPRDGKVYKTVQIGSQVWMAENLAYDPDTLSHRFNRKYEYGFCYYFSQQYCQKYGMLYSWEVAKKVCPGDWHLPSKKEFEDLLNVFGNDKRKRFDGLIRIGLFNPKDFAGFAKESTSIIRFHGAGVAGFFWSATSDSRTYADDLSVHLKFKAAKIMKNRHRKSDAVSVRCVRSLNETK